MPNPFAALQGNSAKVLDSLYQYGSLWYEIFEIRVRLFKPAQQTDLHSGPDRLKVLDLPKHRPISLVI